MQEATLELLGSSGVSGGWQCVRAKSSKTQRFFENVEYVLIVFSWEGARITIFFGDAVIVVINFDDLCSDALCLF